MVRTILTVPEFSEVLNASIAASFMILAVVVLRMLLHKSPKWIHVALWGLVAVRLLCPFSIESALSLIPSAETIPEEVMRYEGERLKEPIQLTVIENPVISENVVVELEQSVDRVQLQMMYVSIIWWIGMAAMLLYAFISYARLYKKVQTSVRLRDNIFQSEYVDAPFVLGIVRPKIYLSYKIVERDRDYILAHEQAHISRKDHWWKPLGFLLLTVHWFNPLMWLAYILLCKDIELACDEKVVKTLEREERADYSQALLSYSVSRKGIVACPLAFGEVGIMERVKNVLSYKKPAHLLVAASLLAVLVLAVCFLTNPATGGQDDALAADSDVETDANTKADGNADDAAENVEAGQSADAVFADGVEGFISLGHENYYDDYNDYNIVNYAVNLGENISGGYIYVEQWYRGECVNSIPGVLASDAKELGIRVLAKRDGTGGEVSIWTDAYEGEWLLSYNIPEEDYMYGLHYEAHGQGEILELNVDDEEILAVMVFTGREFSDSVLKEPQKLEDEKQVGYAIVVRAVVGAGASGNIQADGVENTKANDNTEATLEHTSLGEILDLDQLVNVKDKAKRNAYIMALEQICYEHVSPTGDEWPVSMGTKFAIADIDSDGGEELLLQYGMDGGPQTRLLIYDYNEDTKSLHQEVDIYPSFTLYDNGFVIVEEYKNWGMSTGEDFWPYRVYQYNEKTDSYDFWCTVDAWDKERGEEAWTGDVFSDEVDLDGDGRLFFIIFGDEEIDYDDPIDNEEYYQKWLKTITGEPRNVELDFTELPYVLPEAEA